MPRPHKRAKVRAQKARATQLAQQQAETKKLTPRQYARRRAIGWVLVGIAVVVGASHWMAHLGMLYKESALMDLTVGYPMAAALGIGGAIILSK